MTKSLTSTALHALAWSFIEGLGLRIVQFAIGIVLARILMPEQYGLVGMLTVFMGLAAAFQDSGFGAALVQKKTITSIDCSSIFYFNILMGIIVTALLWLISPWVAAFYNQPTLVWLLRVMSLTILFSSFYIVQNLMLIRDVNYRLMTKITFISGLYGGIIGIAWACQGMGVWSLAAQSIMGGLSRGLLLWMYSQWRPTWVIDLKCLREMYGFGSKLLVSSLLNTTFENIYLVVIGKVFTIADLGYYTKANSLQQIPSLALTSMVGRVTFPVFSTIQDDPARIKRGMKKALSTMVFVNFPLMIMLSLIARPLILLLLTEKWAPSISYFQLLCMVGLSYPMHAINLNVLQAMGRSDLFLRLEIIKKALIVANILITWRLGITAMIIGQIFISVGSYYLNAYYNRYLLSYSIWEQAVDVSPYFLSAALMGGMLGLMLLLPIENITLLMGLQILAGSLFYLILCRLLKLSACLETEEILLKRLKKNLPIVKS